MSGPFALEVMGQNVSRARPMQKSAFFCVGLPYPSPSDASVLTCHDAPRASQQRAGDGQGVAWRERILMN